MKTVIQVEGLDELRARFRRFPQKYNAVLRKTMEAGLVHMQSQVPGYPPAPESSDYRRTGLLGRSLGVNMSGGSMGRADIQKIETINGMDVMGSFGTNVEYGPQVIGDRDWEQQQPWKEYWWTLPNTVVAKAQDGILRLFKLAAEKLAAFLDRGVQ